MRSFVYERPETLAEAVALLARHGPAVRMLAGGTDLIIRLRDGTLHPDVVVDLKRVAELAPTISEERGRLVIGATAAMTDIAAHPRIRRDFVALAEAASVIGSVQIRNRATLGGNICNASPAADTAPPLLVYAATIVAVGPHGTRRIPVDEFFVRSGQTTLRPGELVSAIELPVPGRPSGSVHLRRTRRRGHDLASLTLSCSVDEAGVTRLAYGSVGPRPILAVDESGVLADPRASEQDRASVLERMFAAASPSPRSMRASPEYRLAMLRVLGGRAVDQARGRLAEGSGREPHVAVSPTDARHGRRASGRGLRGAGSMRWLELTVNGRWRALEVPVHHTLLDVLRDDLGLTGSKECCLVGECGACTVMLDSRTVDACLVLAVEADGAEVRTVEGLARDGRLSRLQQHFLHCGAAQCGFCIPGQLMSAEALLELHPHPTPDQVQEGMAGNLCRCGAYPQISEAILRATEGGDR